MNAAGFKLNMEINLKNYSMLRKWVYIAETSHVQQHIKNRLQSINTYFLKNSFHMLDKE